MVVSNSVRAVLGPNRAYETPEKTFFIRLKCQLRIFGLGTEVMRRLLRSYHRRFLELFDKLRQLLVELANEL